jgi:hypothetical protein
MRPVVRDGDNDLRDTGQSAAVQNSRDIAQKKYATIQDTKLTPKGV